MPPALQQLARLDGLWWLLGLLLPALFLQRRLHREIQSVFLLITRRLDITIALFSILFFPGVLLHEASHFIMAKLLGVRTGGFSLIPRPLEDGRLQLGYVETARTDVARDALIGAAPLFSGGAFTAFAGMTRLGLPELWASLAQGDPQAWYAALGALLARPDFWLWFYLTFAVSSTMLPSASDRRSWLPISLFVVLLLALGLLAGAGPWLLENLAPGLNALLQAVAVVFAISVVVHGLLWPPFWALRRLLTRLTGLEVV